jgi:predicted amidophosphoribosyltransferase
MILQSAIRAIYPAQCVACDSFTDTEGGLCGPCRRDTHFIGGVICDTCGTPLAGEDQGDVLQCDDCMMIARPWDRGRAALVYTGVGRRLVMALKHGDRIDLARPAAAWMARAAAGLVTDDVVIVPVPLHWTRLFRRRYNQAAELAKALGRETGQTVCVDALRRPRRTKPLEGHSRMARFEALTDAITVAENRAALIQDRHVLLVDDVMTSGATLAAAAEAARSGGAKNVSIVTLARVVKDT